MKVVKPINLVIVGCESNAATSVPRNRDTRQRLEFLIQIIAVFLYLRYWQGTA